MKSELKKNKSHNHKSNTHINTPEIKKRDAQLNPISFFEQKIISLSFSLSLSLSFIHIFYFSKSIYLSLETLLRIAIEKRAQRKVGQ